MKITKKSTLAVIIAQFACYVVFILSHFLPWGIECPSSMTLGYFFYPRIDLLGVQSISGLLSLTLLNILVVLYLSYSIRFYFKLTGKDQNPCNALDEFSYAATSYGMVSSSAYISMMLTSEMIPIVLEHYGMNVDADFSFGFFVWIIALFALNLSGMIHFFEFITKRSGNSNSSMKFLRRQKVSLLFTCLSIFLVIFLSLTFMVLTTVDLFDSIPSDIFHVVIFGNIMCLIVEFLIIPGLICILYVMGFVIMPFLFQKLEQKETQF